MRFGQLINSDPAAFNKAARDFKAFGNDVQDHVDDFKAQVHQQLRDISNGGLWSGDAAKAAQVPMGDLLLALNRAAEQVEAVYSILTAHEDQLAELKSRLNGIVASARDAGIRISDDGEVTVPAAVVQRAAQAGMPHPYLAVTEDIKGVLESATKLDEQTSKALEKALAAESLDAREVGGDYRDAVKDAKRAAALLKEHPTDEARRTEILKLLKEHADDPEFASTLLNDLGGKGTMKALKWVTDLAGPTADLMNLDVPKKELRALQTSLGDVLALGTDPDSDFHVDMSDDSKWMSEFKSAGRSQFGEDYDDPYGYQVLGATLHHGEYSAEFLNEVGDDIVDMDKANPEVFQNFNRMEVEQFDLNFIDNVGGGHDPINGLMMAMERNAEAATEFFNPEHDDKNGYSRIGYLLDRDDWTDSRVGAGGEPRPGDSSQSLVIDAIDSATHGSKLGDPGYFIAKETIAHVGHVSADVGGLNNAQSRESMANLLEGQIGNVHGSFVGGDSNFDQGALSRVLGDVAHSPDAYANVANAERAHAALEMQNLVDARGVDISGPGDPAARELREDLARDATNMGKVLAHLDEGKANALETSWQDREDAYNDRVKTIGELGGYALGKAVSSLPGGDLLVGAAVDDMVDRASVDYDQYADADAARLHDKDRVLGADMVEQNIWEKQLYEVDRDSSGNVIDPPPRSLFRGDAPIPLADMDDRQRADYLEWKQGNDAYQDGAQRSLNDVRDAYLTESGAGKQSQGRN